MSHYSVGVVIDGTVPFERLENKLSEILHTYDENMEVEPYLYKTKTDIIDEVLKSKEEYKSFCELMETDEEEFDKQYPRFNKEYIKNRYEEIKDKTEMELYEEYIEGELLDDDGNILATYNPKSKWDWWTIGGRWPNLLAVKHGTEGINSSMVTLSAFDDEIPERNTDTYKGVNGARFKDINFELARYFRYDFDSKEDLLNRYDLDDEFKEEIGENYGSLENFINQIESQEALAYAMVINGEWIEPGKMGWWAMSDETDESRKVYNEKITEYFEDHKDSDDWLVIVDCHI